MSKCVTTIRAGRTYLDIEYYYTPYQPGGRYEPPTPECIEIEAITHNGVDIYDAIYAIGNQANVCGEIVDEICRMVSREIHAEAVR